MAATAWAATTATLRTGIARLLEFDPAYGDVILQRYEQVTDWVARLAVGDASFADVAEQQGHSAGASA